MLRWLPAVLWAVVIFLASTDSFSSANTSRFIVPFLHWMLPHATPETIARLHFFVRKAAHFTEYFIFSMLLFRALRRQAWRWELRLALAAVAICTGYALLDEFHQSFVASRTASIWDSMIDTSGAAAAQVILWLVFWAHARKSSEEARNEIAGHAAAEPHE